MTARRPILLATLSAVSASCLAACLGATTQDLGADRRIKEMSERAYGHLVSDAGHDAMPTLDDIRATRVLLNGIECEASAILRRNKLDAGAPEGMTCPR